MKSRVQRGRHQLHRMLTDCCPVQTAADGTINDYQSNPSCTPQHDSKPSCACTEMRSCQIASRCRP